MLEEIATIEEQARARRTQSYSRRFATVSIVIDGIGFSREFTLEDSRRLGDRYGTTEKRLRQIVNKARKVGLESHIRIVDERGEAEE